MNRTVFWSVAVMVSIGIGVRSYFDDADPGASVALLPASAPDETAVVPAAAGAAEAVFDTDGLASALSEPAVADAASADQNIARLAIDAKSDDADKRAAAIEQLALMPRAQAIPLLQGLLSATEEADRQHVLAALRTLALDQGDADGAIRELLRLTIYDGDDADVASSALLILDAIELTAADS
jgi:hypothetical protein